MEKFCKNLPELSNFKYIQQEKFQIEDGKKYPNLRFHPEVMLHKNG